jgi:hypothetical protein
VAALAGFDDVWVRRGAERASHPIPGELRA